MSLMEQKSAIDCLAFITEQLEQNYEQRQFGKRICFVNKFGTLFNAFKFPGENAVAIEYADNETDASNGRFEDGDRFYLEDYETENELLSSIMKEIEETV